MKMLTEKLIRWSGVISVLAGAFYALAAFLHPVGEDLAAINHPNWAPAHLLYWVAVVLIQLGLVGLYARQADRIGWLGLIGFVLAFIGTAFVGAIVFMVAALLPLIAATSPAVINQATTPPVFAVLILVLGYGLGYILFGVATMRAGVLPRWSGLLLIIGVSLFMISEAPLFDRMLSHVIVTLGDIVFGLGLAWMGFALWSEKRVPVSKGQPSLQSP
jgi:hypothetical protein